MSNSSSGEMAESVARYWPETRAGDELTLLWGFLDFLRATAVNKVAGLSRAEAAGCPFPASPEMNALGVLRHLTAVERWWLTIVGGGSDRPDLWGDTGDHDYLFRLGRTGTPAELVAAYQEEWRISREALAGLTADDAVRRPGEDKTVRWVLTHLIQETARHVGHLDVLREFADGEVGE
ncbi:DinB family protein [Amycolatopsis sp. 195334CR]|uniref:DinB family protein n=1 Tax=Amycolatopsis sp. 195334CR TaxID=2814588 RepID=UPI001A8F921E|nr:DinB family protein [Amycolatopsis sp. 195334CR]MBN6034985.1 DinB family protein [Amycolatopsis sp. 195334CR]